MNEDRPTFHKIYMDLAHGMSERSTCRRLKVGCSIVSEDFRKVLAVGYNGGASGLKNDCDTHIPGQCGCLHAEENAVINCDVPRHTIKVVYCTHLPCVMCAKRLINLGGVLRVHFQVPYRVVDSVNLFLDSGIEVIRYLPSGVSEDGKEHLIRVASTLDRYAIGLPDNPKDIPA